MHRLLWLCVFPFSATGFSPNNLEVDKNSYGPYNIKLKKFANCDNKNLPKTEITIDGDMLMLNLTLSKPCVLAKSKSRVSVKRIRGDKKITIFNYGISDPCTHFAMAPLLKQYMKVSKSCTVEVGTYSVTIQLQQSTYTFLGTHFFYGEFEFNSILRCVSGTLACIVVNSEFSKKIESKTDN